MKEKYDIENAANMLKWNNPKIRPVQTTQEQSSEGIKIAESNSDQ